jgi:hypothetical protein
MICGASNLPQRGLAASAELKCSKVRIEVLNGTFAVPKRFKYDTD